MPTFSGQERGRVLLILANQYTYSNGDRESSASALLSSTIALKPYDTNPRNPTQPLNRVQNNPFRNRQTRLSDDRPVDRPYAPVDRAGRLGPTESWGTSVGRPPGRPISSCGRPDRSTATLCMSACTSVDRTGRPCFCCC